MFQRFFNKRVDKKDVGIVQQEYIESLTTIMSSPLWDGDVSKIRDYLPADVSNETIQYVYASCAKPKNENLYPIVPVRNHPECLERAVAYFSLKWNIDRQVYQDSISDGMSTEKVLPRWYLMFREDEIIGGYGLIENDFMVRKDLMPWLCALYVEENERGKSLGSRLLSHGRREATKLGFEKVYLCTDHVGYYEKYGWRFLGMEKSEWGGNTRVYEIESKVNE
jgi:GNAT superfamily N-acetyltransferase